MKKILFITVALLLSFAASSQTQRPVFVTSGGKVVTRVLTYTDTVTCRDTLVVRLIDSLFPYYDLKRDFGAIGDSVTDDTQAWSDAMDTLISKGGGSLYVPAPSVAYRVVDVSGLRNYSNITIFGDGDTSRIFVDGGRGVLFQLADGTDNFKVKDLQVEVDADDVATFGHGMVCNRDAGVLTNITIDNIYYHGEARLAGTVGVQLVSFYTSTGSVTNLTVKNCRYYSPGRNCYGIHVEKPNNNTRVYNNYLEMENYGLAANVGFNAIAIYANSQYFDVYNNVVNGSGHSAIAVSPGSHGSIYGNHIKNVRTVAEAGIEVEYKEHSIDGVNTSSSVMVFGNTVDSCTYGLLATIRLPAVDTLAPFGIVFDGNTMRGCTEGIFVGSSLGTVPTKPIRNVSITNNIIEGSTGSSSLNGSIAIWDGNSISISGNIINNTASTGIMLGRSSTFFPNNISITNNHIDTSVSYSIFLNYGDEILVMGNMIDSTAQRGIKLQGTLGDVQIIGNKISNCVIGIEGRNNANAIGNMMVNNRIKDCSNRPIDCNYPYLSALGNIFEDVGVAVRLDGTNLTSDNNVTLP